MAAVGLDFGTTNSSVAVATWDGAVELVRFEGGTESFRSLLYLQQERRAGRTSVAVYTGPAAVARYVGRHAAAVERPGRLVQSLKSYLAVRNLSGTEVFGRRYTLEELIGRMLTDLRAAATAYVGAEVTRAVVGRPVRFVGAETEGDDAFALGRLREALRIAGFAEVEFLPEPIAAAYAYEVGLERDELVLIGDFGGGTSDFSLLRVGPGARGLPVGERLLGTAGVGLAGDAFDAKLVRYLVAPALGSESTVDSFGKPLPAVPAWIYANLERWHYLSSLRTRNAEQILATARQRATAAADGRAVLRAIDALITLIDEDLGYALHGAVGRTKAALSLEERDEFGFREAGLALRRMVTRAEFEGWIRPEVAAIEAAVDGLLRTAGVEAVEIDRVFLTGGTSFVPAVRRVFAERFGEERVRLGEAFTSVARGLGRYAASR